MAATDLEARRAVQVLTARQSADLAAAWEKVLTVAGLDPGRVRSVLAEILPALGDSYWLASSALAADWYDDSRDAARVSGKFRAIPAPTVTGARWDSLAGWAVGPLFGADPNPAAVLSKLSDGLQGTTADGFRQTVMRNAIADPAAIGWRRVGVGDSCPFCALLISRQAVYRDATVHFRAHDNCNCTAAAAFDV